MFSLRADSHYTQARAKQITVVHIRTLKMTDDVLAVKYSPNGKLLAVSLLDSTVKVFYQDTLKFFLSLYGHKVSTTQIFRRTLPDCGLLASCPYYHSIYPPTRSSS
jgi:WD40 repeat protein